MGQARPIFGGPSQPCHIVHAALSLLGQLQGLATKLRKWEGTWKKPYPTPRGPQLQAPKGSKLTRTQWKSTLQAWTPWETYHPPLLPNPEMQPLPWKPLPCYEIHRGGDTGLVFIFSCQVAGFRSQEEC